MSLKPVYWWYKVPFGRILFVLIAGIILQWQLRLPAQSYTVVMILSFILLVFYSFLSINLKFRHRIIAGLMIHLLIFSGGALLVCENKLHDQLFLNSSSGKEFQIAVIKEPLSEKPRSYKTIADIKTFSSNNPFPVHEEKIIVYFKKDSTLQLSYGSVIIFKKQIQEIKNSGNPGSFDYKLYCHFNGISGQVYLDNNEFILLNHTERNWFYSFILDTRSWVISQLQKFLRGEKVQGLAEALLIGYKEDLDKDLVQAYANTGVVHVIAISGLHLGLIYWLLLLITKPLSRKKTLIWIRLIIILSSLWIFSILAGAQPSVLRSAVMFSFIAWGSVVQRSASIFNTLSLSAFVLLCYNPFWLWDAGFQLSYAAVLSIVVFFKPIYNWFCFENRLLDLVWKLMAVTVAAQLLTLPVSIYHFHQLPTLFLLTNMVAVPLSSLILFGEILLCVFSFSETIAGAVGFLLEWMITQLNHYIENMNRIPFAVWDDLSINFFQATALLLFISCFSCWLMAPRKYLLWLSILALLVMTTIRSVTLLEAINQRKIVIYNIPGQTAIDIMDGTQCFFWGDEIVMNDDFLRNFHIRPCRISHRVQSLLILSSKEYKIDSNQFLLIDTTISLQPKQVKPSVNLLILAKNPKIRMTSISHAMTIRQVVITGSVPAWKARQWKKDCDSLQIPCHIVTEKGAFLMNWQEEMKLISNK